MYESVCVWITYKGVFGGYMYRCVCVWITCRGACVCGLRVEVGVCGLRVEVGVCVDYV